MKNNKILIILLTIVLVLSVGVGSYFIFDSIYNKEPETNNDLNNNQGNNNNDEPQVVDITNTDLAKNLHKTLITSDGSYGLYFKDKVSITGTANKYFLNFNFRNYIEKNKLNSKIYAPCGEENVVEIKKSDFNLFIQNIYDTNYNFDFSVGEIIMVGGTTVVKSEENDYIYYCRPTSGMAEKVSNIMLKAEQADDYIYIYDNAVYCEDDPGYRSCYNVIGVECNETGCKLNQDNLIYECTYNYDDTYNGSDFKCTNNGPSVLEEMSTYIMNNMRDKLHTFKHTFKKGSDGNYYWVASEISK